MGYVQELRKLVGKRPIILVGSAVILLDQEDRILLQQRRHPKGKWGLPGGLMELGESTEEVAKREVLEETGLHIDNLHLLNVYSGSDQFTIAENGDQFYVVTTVYYTVDYAGQIVADPEESLQLEYFRPNELPDYMVGSHRMMINEYLHRFNT
ncbi:NUDIX hydrolase [Ornithinibacillus gellani]|uniref:NUDIX hydrolase n=1 Tax=Ornithinibacillus gellani TaxID=2293253 RepID=UPI000F46F26D|nr:NUDIX hydrolase [Ornithinibacillus gellani]TQS70659.1 NUDIX hydrolase [Ornithinibacillus gellani]